MDINCTLILVLSLLLPSLSYSKNDEWKLTLDKNNVKVFQLKQQESVTGTYQVLKNNRILEISKDHKKMIKDFSDHKRKTLEFIGIKEWKIKSYEFNGDKKGFVLKGSYLDTSNTLINFREEHIWKVSKSIQILNTWPSNIKIEEKVITDFIIFIKEDTKT